MYSIPIPRIIPVHMPSFLTQQKPEPSTYTICYVPSLYISVFVYTVTVLLDYGLVCVMHFDGFVSKPGSISCDSEQWGAWLAGLFSVV